MNQLWIVFAALVALLLFTRIRARRRPQPQRAPVPGPRIQGYQVRAYVHPRMSAACLYDHGVQFGRGFRRKDGPRLPHDPRCRCEAVPFSFTSSEVFNGALRQVRPVESSIPGLAGAEAARLIEGLKAAEAGGLPADDAAYAAAVGVADYPAGVREALRAFLSERLAYLRETPHTTEPLTPEGMETVEPT